MDPSSGFDRDVDESTSQYRDGLFMGMWDTANGEYEPHPYAFPLVQPMSTTELEGYRDALDDSDDQRDERTLPLVHVVRFSGSDLIIPCGARLATSLWNVRVAAVTCADCQAAHDAASETPEPFDPEETIVP